jgi:hypothetical protein
MVDKVSVNCSALAVHVGEAHPGAQQALVHPPAAAPASL